MSTSRRRFLQTSAALGLTTLVGAARLTRARSEPTRSPDGKLRVLILGGTGFLGPRCIDAALARGHHVTIFNSGRTEDRRKQAGRPSAVPDGVEILYGNRDPNKTAAERKAAGAPDAKPDPDSPKGLTQLEGKTWDAVIDTSGYFPRMVKASAELLAPNVGQYVFISTLSVYAKNDTPNQDESAELAVLDDPTTEDFGPDFRNYGGGKAACELAAEKAMPGRVSILRPGFIVGMGDTTRRWIYWPLRVRAGGEMIVPGTPNDPIQFIDVRDLADFVIRCIEIKAVGAYNVTGPAQTLTMKAMIEGCAKGAASDAKPVWIDPKFLQEHHVPTERFSLWIPPEGEGAGFHQRSIKKALAAGLTFRSVEDTTKSTLEWYDALPDNIKQGVAAVGLAEDQEAEVIKAWREKKG